MSWLEVVPVALVSAAWLFGPGVALTYALGLRGLAAWGVAPALSVALLSVTAVVAAKAGVAWSVPLVLIVSVVAAVLALGVAFVFRSRFGTGPKDPRALLVGAALGLVPALIYGWYVLSKGMTAPDQINQTYDAIFHYNALAYIVDEGNASSLGMITLGNPQTPPAFYPAAWHGIGALVKLSTGASVVVTANVLSGIIAILVWPVSCLLLVRQVVGRSIAAMVVTGLLSLTFTAFPWGLLGFGVLWPNVLGLSFVPAGLAAVLSISTLSRDDVIGPVRSWILLPILLMASGFAHPNALFSFATIAFFPVAIGVYRYFLRRRAEGRTARGLVVAGVFLLGSFGAWRFAATTPAFARVREQYWAPFETPARAIGEVMLNAPNGRHALWALSLFMLFGMVAAWQVRHRRWVLAAFAATGFLFMLTAALNRPSTQDFTGYWYNDSFRLAAMLPITAVPLVVMGFVFIAEKVAVKAGTLNLPAALKKTGVYILTVMLGLMLTSKFFYFSHQIDALAPSYLWSSNTTGATQVDPDEMAFMEKLDDLVPKDAVVANNPWDGSAVMLAAVARKPLFPHVDIPWSEDQKYVAGRLDAAARDPQVCTAAKNLGVSYMLLGNKTFWPLDPRVKKYPGISFPGQSPAFELVARNGEVRLYKLVGCDRPMPQPSR